MSIDPRHFVLDTQTGCWVWIFHTDANGYGVKTVAGQKKVRAHRWSYEQSVGPIPDGMQVLHLCDTPACINPDHLVLGTQSDNMRDMAVKGRALDGARSKHTNLTDDDVRAILDRTDAGERHADVAAEFGITVYALRQMRYGHNWKHIERGED